MTPTKIETFQKPLDMTHQTQKSIVSKEINKMAGHFTEILNKIPIEISMTKERTNSLHRNRNKYIRNHIHRGIINLNLLFKHFITRHNHFLDYQMNVLPT